jgi:hypothetical protein
MSRPVELTDEELEMIADDQRCALESIHIVFRNCKKYENCPVSHFDSDMKPDYIALRQELLRRLN